MLESVYVFLKQFIEVHGYAPNLREIAKGCYISTSTVARYLDCLEAQGRISREIGAPVASAYGSAKTRHLLRFYPNTCAMIKRQQLRGIKRQWKYKFYSKP